jgi:hypothetical protein
VPLTVALAAALAAVLAGADAGGVAAAPVPALDADAPAERSVRVEAALHLRWTSARGLPSTDVLYDPAERTFAVDRYLGRGELERYGSAFASLRIAGTHLDGDLRWVLGVDTGEVRRRTYPAAEDVCVNARGSGFSPPGSLTCRALGVGTVTLETTASGDRTWTSNGRAFRDEADATFLVREAYAAYSFGRAGFATARVGRKRLTVGDGLVHDDYALGAEVDLDLGAVGPPFQVVAGVYDPSRDWPRPPSGLSPMGVVRLDWLPSLFEHAGVFAAALHDRTGSVGELVRSGVVENRVAALARALGTAAEARAGHELAAVLLAPLESDASMTWLGTSGSLAPLRGQRLGWTLATMSGTLNRLSSSRALADADVTWTDIPLRGHAESVRWDSDLGKKASVGAFLLHLSGGQPLSRSNKDEYHPFLGVAPYVTATNLFFGGGLAETFASRHVTAPGVNGRGVLAPGLRVSFDPVEKVGVRAKGAYLRADAVGPFGGRVYGTEADLEVTWSPAGWLVLGAELDVLWPGDFYRDVDRAPMTKAVLALDLLTP